jgi:hypothetical protein
VRDEPGVGAFVVTLALEPADLPPLRLLRPGEIERLRATKKIVGERADALFELVSTMPPPEIHAVPGQP